jgi:hypothetical protein
MFSLFCNIQPDTNIAILWKTGHNMGRSHISEGKKNVVKKVNMAEVLSIQEWSWDLLAHAYNPSYLGGRNQEYHSLKPAGANSSSRPSRKTPHKYSTGGVA